MGNSFTTGMYEEFKKTVLTESWYETYLDKEDGDQKAELKRLFNVVADNDATSDEKGRIQDQIDDLEGRLGAILAEIEDLKEQIAEKQEAVSYYSEQIANKVAKATSDSETYPA